MYIIIPPNIIMSTYSSTTTPLRINANINTNAIQYEYNTKNQLTFACNSPINRHSYIQDSIQISSSPPCESFLSNLKSRIHNYHNTRPNN